MCVVFSAGRPGVEFELNDEQKMAKRNMGRFLNKEIAPIANRGDQQGPFTRDEKVILVRKAGRSCKTGIKIF